MYIPLSQNPTKKRYREILDSAIIQAERDYKKLPEPLNASIYNQLMDIKNTVVEQKTIYTEEELDKRYPLGTMVVRNFDVYFSVDWDYPKQLMDIAGGISIYPTMKEE